MLSYKRPGTDFFYLFFEEPKRVFYTFFYRHNAGSGPGFSSHLCGHFFAPLREKIRIKTVTGT